MLYDVFKGMVNRIIGDDISEEQMDAMEEYQRSWEEYDRREDERLDREVNTKLDNEPADARYGEYEEKIRQLEEDNRLVREDRDRINREYKRRFWEGETVTDSRIAGASEGAYVDDNSTAKIAEIAADLFKM